MGALPKKKTSNARKKSRRAHDRLRLGSLILCTHCRRPQMSHHVCPNCGYYRGRQVIAEKPARAAR